MKKIFVENALFETNNKKSTGLISGLKKLSVHNFQISTKNLIQISAELKQILKLEDIYLHEYDERNKNEYLNIVTKASRGEKNIIIDSKKIKNIGDAVDQILQQIRSAAVKRTTKETKIEINLQLDGEGKSKVKTGIGFFDHMLDQIARHANLNLLVFVNGDLQVDEHHTIEDTGIALGEAIKNALGDKRGIKRYGYFIPMDEAVAVCSIDLSGRNFLNFNCKFSREYVGEMPTEMVKEFFRGVATGMLANIYLKAKGDNDHHKIESMFKAFAKALNEACRIDERAKGALPSTKGLL